MNRTKYTPPQEPTLNSFDHLFSWLTPKELNILEANKKKVHYHPGENILKPGETISEAIYLYSGFLKVQVEYLQKDYVVDIIPFPNFALLTAMLSDLHHQYSLKALEETTIFYIDMEHIKNIIKNNDRFSLYLLQNAWIHSNVAHNKFVSMIQNNIYGKVANTLLYLIDHVFQSTHFNVLLDRVELAEFSGVSRENFIKVLSELHKEGVLATKGKVIQILDYSRLYQIPQNC